MLKTNVYLFINKLKEDSLKSKNKKLKKEFRLIRYFFYFYARFSNHENDEQALEEN
jgi:hypothetical protein